MAICSLNTHLHESATYPRLNLNEVSISCGSDSITILPLLIFLPKWWYLSWRCNWQKARNLQLSSGLRHSWSKVGDAKVESFLLECIDGTVKLKGTKRRPISKPVSKPRSRSRFALSQCWISWNSHIKNHLRKTSFWKRQAKNHIGKENNN